MALLDVRALPGPSVDVQHKCTTPAGSTVLWQAVLSCDLCPISECCLMVGDTFLLSHPWVQCMLGAVCGELKLCVSVGVSALRRAATGPSWQVQGSLWPSVTTQHMGFRSESNTGDCLGYGVGCSRGYVWFISDWSIMGLVISVPF